MVTLKTSVREKQKYYGFVLRKALPASRIGYYGNFPNVESITCKGRFRALEKRPKSAIHDREV